MEVIERADAIGALEEIADAHDPALRPYFAAWDRNDELREAYRLAMDWGAAHEE